MPKLMRVPLLNFVDAHWCDVITNVTTSFIEMWETYVSSEPVSISPHRNMLIHLNCGNFFHDSWKVDSYLWKYVIGACRMFPVGGCPCRGRDSRLLEPEVSMLITFLWPVQSIKRTRNIMIWHQDSSLRM